MGLVKEFKEFAVKGNVVDMAVGVIVGAAFGKVVSSLVENVLMPPLGVLVGGIDLSGFEILLRGALSPAIPAVTLKYGLFLQAIVNFTIQAFAVFLVIKGINTIKRTLPTPPPPPPAKATNEEILLSEIRDLLKKNA